MAMRIHVPVATDGGKPITGVVRAAWTAAANAKGLRRDRSGDVRRRRSRRSRQLARGVSVDAHQPLRGCEARGTWRVKGHAVTLDTGFVPGTTCRVSYRAANPPVAGLGFVAIRDTAAWLKTSARSARAGAVRLRLRILAERTLPPQLHVRRLQHRRTRSAGVRRGLRPHRRRLAPRSERALGEADRARRLRRLGVSFADASLADPVTGARDGLLANPRTGAHAPEGLLHEYAGRVLGRRPRRGARAHDS